MIEERKKTVGTLFEKKHEEKSQEATAFFPFAHSKKIKELFIDK